MVRSYLLNDCAVLILAFNRPDLVDNSLSRLVGSGARNIWIAIDGPRADNILDQAAHEEIRSICQLYGIPASQTRIATDNLGCRRGVMSGITWFLEQTGSGIILEDDIEVQAEYMEVISVLLESHKDDKTVFSISSHFEFSGTGSQAQDGHGKIFRSPLCRVWGWATWKDRWERHLSICEQVLTIRPLDCFLALPQTYRTANAAMRLAACQAGKFDTWDYEWNFSHLYSNACSLTPNGIHCLNHGFRGDATHTTLEQAPWNEFSGLPASIEFLFAYAPGRGVPGDAKRLMDQCGYPQTRWWYWHGLQLLKHEIRQSL